MQAVLGWLFTFFILFHLSFSIEASQALNSEFQGRVENQNFRVYDDLLILRFFIDVPKYNFALEDTSDLSNPAEPVGKDLAIEPNIGSNFGIGIAYGGYGVSGSLPNANSNKDTSIYGHTDRFDFQFYYTSRHWGVDFFYQNYKGFYLDNPVLYNPGFRTGDVYPQFSTLKILNIGVGGFYNLNENYSSNAAFSQGERQLTSAGSFIVDTSISFLRLNTSESLVPASEKSFYPDLDSYRGGEYIIWSVKPGYGYNLVYGRLTLGGMFALGPALQRQYSKLLSIESRETIHVDISVDIKLSAWFEFKEQFAGVMAMIESNRISIEQFALESQTASIQLFYGMIIGNAFD